MTTAGDRFFGVGFCGPHPAKTIRKLLSVLENDDDRCLVIWMLFVDANDQDQAAGTGKCNHWQPTLPPLACILWLWLRYLNVLQFAFEVGIAIRVERPFHAAKTLDVWPNPGEHVFANRVKDSDRTRIKV